MDYKLIGLKQIVIPITGNLFFSFGFRQVNNSRSNFGTSIRDLVLAYWFFGLLASNGGMVLEGDNVSGYLFS